MRSGDGTTLPPSPVQSLNPDHETSRQQDASFVQTNGLRNEPPVRTADPVSGTISPLKGKEGANGLSSSSVMALQNNTSTTSILTAQLLLRRGECLKWTTSHSPRMLKRICELHSSLNPCLFAEKRGNWADGWTSSIVRMSSWRGKVTVSGEWKECDYDGAMIVRFLEDMVGILLSLIERD